MFWNWFIAFNFFIGVVTTLSLITMGLVYIGGWLYGFIMYHLINGYWLLLFEKRSLIMTQFIEALPAFGICLALWLVGFMIFDPKSWMRLFK